MCSLPRCYFVFFFFKQKTAYEMRISDWSSDVCSSDLVKRVLWGPVTTEHVKHMTPMTPRETWVLIGFAVAVLAIGVWPQPLIHQIGRASCRERVGQYV